MKKRVLSMVLVLLSTLFSISGCMQKDNNSSDSQTDTTGTSYTTNDGASNIDFGGKTIIVSGWTDAVIPQLGKSDSGDANYYALEYAKKKYNVNIEYKIMPEQEYFDSFVKSSLSGSKFSDIALAHCWTYVLWIQQGLLDPVTEYMKNEEDASWEKNISLFKGDIWGVNKKAPLVIPKLAFFVNTKILSELGLTNPQELARNNEWNWDKFREYCRLATDPSQERYGVSAFMLPDALRYSNGAFAYVQEDGKFYNGYTHPSTKKNALELLEFLAALKIDDKSVLGDETGGFGAMDLATESFKNGKLLFTFAREPKLLKKEGFSDYSIVTVPLGPSAARLDNYLDGFSFWAIPSSSDYETSDLVAFWKDAQTTWDKSRGDAYYEFNLEEFIETLFASSYVSRSDVEFLVEMGKDMKSYGTLNTALSLGEIEVWDIFQQVLLGMSTPSSAISATDSKIQNRIDSVLNN